MNQQHPLYVPLVINGKDCQPEMVERGFNADGYGKASVYGYDVRVQAADGNLCNLAVDSSAQAFESWRDTNPHQRRELLLRLANLLREREIRIESIIVEEINCSPEWAHINLEDSIKLIEEAAALVTSSSMNGLIPHTRATDSLALVLKEPLGVVLGIAPWNAPLILGFRAVVAPIAAGNTAILKGSELSPRTHYFIARLFQDAGFPPGVLNFLLHREQDAPEVFQTLIRRREIRKCNFTGSTPVGRIVASQAAAALKPVLLELGGKNYAVVLEDADLDKAAKEVAEGALLNSGQICMSTDIVLVEERVLEAFRKKLFHILENPAAEICATPVITSKSAQRIRELVEDAKSKGATVTEVPTTMIRSRVYSPEDIIPATVIENLDSSMSLYSQEAFGPLVGIIPVSSQAEAAQILSKCTFGLSAAIFSTNHFACLNMAKRLQVGAVHINAATVHDESTLPHGGHGDSGWGRFGATWGLEEFLQTKTIILNE